jgi:hypothetical protein
MWKYKEKEAAAVPDFEQEGEILDVEHRKKALQNELKRLEEKKVPEKQPQVEKENTVDKQELIDIIEGNLNRVHQLVDVLRSL